MRFVLKEKLLDKILEEIETGKVDEALLSLNCAFSAPDAVELLEQLLCHRLVHVLLENPLLGRMSNENEPASDLEWLDMIYEEKSFGAITRRGEKMFSASMDLPFVRAFRFCRAAATDRIANARAESKRICIVNCGRFREGDKLCGQDLTTLTLVENDPAILVELRAKFGHGVVLERDTATSLLKRIGILGEVFDLIYGFVDLLPRRENELIEFFRAAERALAPYGMLCLTELSAETAFSMWSNIIPGGAGRGEKRNIAAMALKAGLDWKCDTDESGLFLTHEITRSI